MPAKTHSLGATSPQDVAHEIVSAADFRFGHMHVHQLPSSPLGVLRAGASRLAHVEQRDTGRVQPGGLAAQAQVGALQQRRHLHPCCDTKA
jgi:hypothetical protein